MSFAKPDGDSVLISIKVVPGARRDEIVGPLGDDLKLRVSQPPEDGKANRAVCELLARHLGISPHSVEVIRGHSSPRKLIRARGITLAQVLSRCPN